MDIVVAGLSAYELPSKQRAGAILFDGTLDFRLWTSVPSDRLLSKHYGGKIDTVLAAEAKRAPGGVLAPGSILRIHPGQLHCDMLMWIAARDQDKDGNPPSPATVSTLREGLLEAISFVAERHVTRVALPPLGDGPGAPDVVERLVALASVVEHLDESRIDELILCAGDARNARLVSRRLGRLANRTLVAPEAKKQERSVSKRSAGGSKRKKTLRFDEGELRAGIASARTYSPRTLFEQGQWVDHSKFGHGRVEEVSPDGFISIRFADGSTKRLIHGR